MTPDHYTALLDSADRIVATDLYPAHLRKVVADLATTLLQVSSLLAESRSYASALEGEISARAIKAGHFVAMATSMDDDFQKLRTATEALGTMPEGYCFCSKERIGDDSKTHEPECADLRAALKG